MKKGQISNFLRRLRLIYFADWIRFYVEKYKNRSINKDFKLKNPNVILPPDYLIYESFQMNYHKYYTESIEAAKYFSNLFRKHIELKDKRILDWGCGPGRIIRHMPMVVNNGCEYFGTDYNKESIDWCSKNLSDIQFNKNSLIAQLPYDDNFVDVIYGVSIFTHLSEQLHYDWYNELYRVLKPNGIMVLTTQGDQFKVKLTDSELENYNNNHLVVRGNVKEGHRTYSAFHPNGFMKKLFDKVEILEHIETEYEGKEWVPQDIWILKKI
tara:strand:- start:14439 stop:15242 length:804 start_codon:yes stop_codon:yes gene_type:complete